MIIFIGLISGVYYWHKATARPEPLFVVHSATAEVKINAKENKSYLFVHPIGGKITTFTDRPYRETGSFLAVTLADVWAKDGRDSFAHDPPNGSLAGLWNGKSFTMFIGLRHPVYDEKINSLRFEITRLDGKEIESDKQLSHVTLFIE